jgi:hypothetical protein
MIAAFIFDVSFCKNWMKFELQKGNWDSAKKNILTTDFQGTTLS